MHLPQQGWTPKREPTSRAKKGRSSDMTYFIQKIASYESWLQLLESSGLLYSEQLQVPTTLVSGLKISKVIRTIEQQAI